jgi:pimeloyl-ACP methyl ester carboxylesterase
VASRSARGRIVGGALMGTAGMFAAAVAIRRMDHERCKGQECRLPTLTDAESKDGIYSQDGTRIYVDCCGEGPTVFLVHGLACNNTIWRYQKAFLSQRYRVVTLDLRGHGRSGVPESMDHSTERLAEDLEAVVEAFDPEEFVIVAHSMGGFTTFKWHERFGERYRGPLKGLVFVDSSGVDVVDGIVFGALVKRLYPFPIGRMLDLFKKENQLAQKIMDIYGRSALGYLFSRYVAFGKRPPADEVEFQRELIFSTPLSSFAMSNRACLDYHVDSSLSDMLTAQRSSERTSEMIPQAKLKVYEGSGHDTMLERPEELNNDIGAHLKECFSK